MSGYKDALTGIIAMLVLVAGAVALIVALFLILGWIFSLAWNAFAVPVFGLKEIDAFTGGAAVVLISFISGVFHK